MLVSKFAEILGMLAKLEEKDIYPTEEWQDRFNKETGLARDKPTQAKWRTEVLHDRASAPMFRNKMQEFEFLILKERAYLDQKFQQLVDGVVDKDSVEMGIHWSKGRLETYYKELKKFTYYHHTALGHEVKGPIDIVALKQVSPEFILGKPVWEDSKTATYLCVFHNEKTPSLTWYKKGNKGHCFGCGMNCDVIDVVQKLHNVGFITACQEVKNAM